MNTPLPPVLEQKLSEFRKHVWIIKLTEGLLAAVFGLALSYVLVFILDRFMETPGWLRGTLLAAGAAVLGIGLPLKWHRWVWRQRRLEDAARLIRRRFPRLGDQLLGIVELAHLESGQGGRSETLVRAAMAQAADAVKDQDFTKAVPQARHRSWAYACVAVLALSVAALGLVPDAARNAAMRWLMPWRATERFTFARVDQVPERLVVPVAEPFDFRVALAKDTRWSPAEGTARLTGQDGIVAPLSAAAYPFSFPPQKKDTAIALAVGDVRKTVLVQPRPRPELTSLTAHLKLPTYLQYKTEPALEIHSGSVSILRGAQASFEAKASRELAAAKMDDAAQKVEADRLLTAFAPVEGSAERKFTWQDADGLTPRDPLLLKIQAVGDEAPRITARRETLEQVVLDSEVVAFDLNVQDDFGVKRIGLEWQGVDADDKITPAKGTKIAAMGAPEKRDVEARATFCATRDGVAPQVIEVRAWAEDYLPDRKPSISASFILHVLNKTDHALWLTEQMGKWLGIARESYEREQQLHQTNRELRNLTAAELDRPENRHRVMQQAASENANADRLAALTQSGKQLVEQATKNPEFDAKRLESWATMLKSLKDIAAERMPSVADLLKATGGAQAAKGLASNDKPSPPTSGQGQPQQDPPKPGDAKAGAAKSAPSVKQGELASVPGAAKPVDPNAPPKPAAPSIADNEKGYLKAPEPPKEDPNAAPKPPGGGKLKLPTTTLAAAPNAKKPEETKPPESPAQAKMDQAVTEQKDLLAEFAKVADQLGEILASLESSTFVKRFKAASKQQIQLAGEINQKTLNSFGLELSTVPVEPLKQAAQIAKAQKAQSSVVSVIQSDLEAFFQRKPDMHFRNVLDQMKKTQIVVALAEVGDRTTNNLSGQSIVGSEFWADVLDRWAEEMVAAGKCSSCSSCSGDSLPPEIVLKVMKSLRDEMKLRDETREVENSRSGLEQKVFHEKAAALTDKQGDIGTNTQGALDDILALPQGAEKFGKEVKLLTAVTEVMKDAYLTLSKPDTGAKAVAAETEAIELLLQTRRQKPGGGGGGGGNPGGGGRAASASSAALAELGPGSDANAEAKSRSVGQSTGRAGRTFPEEFRSGLDSYFNALEAQGAK